MFRNRCSINSPYYKHRLNISLCILKIEISSRSWEKLDEIRRDGVVEHVSPPPSSLRGGWARAKVGGLTTCQVLEVPRGRVGRGGGKGIAISLIAGSSTMAGVSRVVVARGTIIRPAKNLVTIGETTSSDQVPMFSRPPPYQLARSRYHLSPPLPSFLPSSSFVTSKYGSKYFHTFSTWIIIRFKIPSEREREREREDETHTFELFIFERDRFRAARKRETRIYESVPTIVTSNEAIRSI